MLSFSFYYKNAASCLHYGYSFSPDRNAAISGKKLDPLPHFESELDVLPPRPQCFYKNKIIICSMYTVTKVL